MADNNLQTLRFKQELNLNINCTEVKLVGQSFGLDHEYCRVGMAYLYSCLKGMMKL